jgi:hypothetical protein
MEELYGFVFWYNDFEKLWYAIPRESYTDFFSGKYENADIMKSKNIDTLIELICKRNIDISSIPQDGK